MTPCKQVCRVYKDVCVGCQRTLDEIKKWSVMDMEDRMKVMKDIQMNRSTHECPSCTTPTYCAMEDGKSSSLCWCMYEQAVERDADYFSHCLCRKCLLNSKE